MPVRPSSSFNLLLTASFLSSPGKGWPQQLLDQTKGQVFFLELLCCSNNSPLELNRKNEKARWRGVSAWCTSALGIVPISLSPPPTKTTNSSIEITRRAESPVLFLGPVVPISPRPGSEARGKW